MHLYQYQEQALMTAKYPDSGKIGGLLYTILGLTGEAGELSNKLKKVLRDDKGVIKPEIREMLISELGDVLWYVATTAHELGTNLEAVAVENGKKLMSRKERGVLGGSGDNR